MSRPNNDSISSRFKFTRSPHTRSSYSKYGSFSATESFPFNPTQSTPIPNKSQLITDIDELQTYPNDIDPHQFDFDDHKRITDKENRCHVRQPSDPRPYKRRKTSTNQLILSPIQINAPPIHSVMSSLHDQNMIHRSRTRSPSMISLRRFNARQPIRYKPVPIRSHSVDCKYRSIHTPPFQTLQKIESMRCKSPAPNLEIVLHSQSQKTKLKARKLPIKPMQMEFICVNPNGIRYFCRSLSPSKRLYDAIECLQLHMKNPKVLYNKELLTGNPFVSKLDENMKLIVYDDINDEHKAETMNKRTRLQIQTILYQSITGLPNAIALFVVELGRLGRLNCAKAWTAILPTNQYPNIKQKYANRSLDKHGAGKVCAVDVLSPFSFGQMKLTVPMDDTIGNLKKIIQRKKRFQCGEMLLFAATQRGPISMHGAKDGDSTPIYCIHDEDEDESMHEMDTDWEGSMSAVDDFMFSLEDYDAGIHVDQTLNTYWIHAELKQRLRNALKKHSMENLQFFQLHDDTVKLCQLPLHYVQMNKSVVSMKTFVYIIPLPTNPYSLRNNESKLKEIYEWCVGPAIAAEMMVQKTIRKRSLSEEEESKHDLVIHFEGVGDGYETTRMFMSESQTVGAFIQKIKALKREYRYKNVDVYVYDQALGAMDTLPLSTRSVLYHSMGSYHNTLHIVIKTQPTIKRDIKAPVRKDKKRKKQNKTRHGGRRSLRQKFSDFVSANEQSHTKMKGTKRAKSTSRAGRTNTIYDPSLIYGAGTPIDDDVIAELNNMNKKRSKSSGITQRTNSKSVLSGFMRRKKTNVRRSRKRKYVFNDD
eukprot:401654_1